MEPNPLVGCVIAHGARVLGEGWHERFGGPHAEVAALAAAGPAARGATAYVTLEPCCHYGKTPPCSEALVAAGLARVVVAQADPFPQVAGGGLAQLRAAGIAVEVGLLEAAARQLNAPYLKLVTQGRPWVIAKWAMTLDGRIATQTGSSQWISNAASRAMVHRLRGRVDAILVGRGTAAADDPLLTARPRARGSPRGSSWTRTPRWRWKAAWSARLGARPCSWPSGRTPRPSVGRGWWTPAVRSGSATLQIASSDSGNCWRNSAADG